MSVCVGMRSRSGNVQNKQHSTKGGSLAATFLEDSSGYALLRVSTAEVKLLTSAPMKERTFLPPW